MPASLSYAAGLLTNNKGSLYNEDLSCSRIYYVATKWPLVQCFLPQTRLTIQELSVCTRNKSVTNLPWQRKRISSTSLLRFSIHYYHWIYFLLCGLFFIYSLGSFPFLLSRKPWICNKGYNIYMYFMLYSKLGQNLFTLNLSL